MKSENLIESKKMGVSPTIIKRAKEQAQKDMREYILDLFRGFFVESNQTVQEAETNMNDLENMSFRRLVKMKEAFCL